MLHTPIFDHHPTMKEKAMSFAPGDFIDIITERGFLNQATDLEALTEKLKKPAIAYCGFDCTADSLHIGSLLPIMLLRWYQKCGHKPIVLMGGGTSKVGDPSGKDESRQLITEEQIAANMAGIKTVFDKYLTFGSSGSDAMMVNNDDWLKDLGYIDFLRDVGRHFSINRMLTFESVKRRLEREQNLSFLEFNYMILQAYDLKVLSEREDCLLQMGGSDQWGNIVAGVELTRRMTGKEVFGLTIPLLTTSTGAKMGKTASGAIWLNDDRLPAYDFWQYWRNVDDADVGRFLKLFTELPMDEIAKLEALGGAEINEAKKILATEVTALCRGRGAADEAAATAAKAFEEGAAADGLPSIDLSVEALNGLSVLDAYVETGLCKSKGEARRLIRQGGAKLNDAPIKDEEYTLGTGDLDGDRMKLSAGKKRHALLIVKD